MRKKLISVLMSLLVVFVGICFAGCSGNNAQNEDVSIPSESQEITDAGYDDNIAGLQAFMKDRSYIKGEAKRMSADFIGANEGYRYDFAGITTELYEFDLQNLSTAAQDVVNSVEEKGSFVILDEEVQAVMSDNGKYMMIYTDNSKRENKDERKNTVEQGFKSFKSGV